MRKMVVGPGLFSPYKPYKRRASKFFHRAVAKRQKQTDGSQILKLECGHRIIMAIPTDSKQVFCSQCVGDYLDMRKKEAANEANGKSD